MNLWLIITKELRQQLRNWKSNSLMILFPVIIIAILGTALSGKFTNQISLSEVRVLYTIDTERPIAAAFLGLTRRFASTGIRVSETKDPQNGLASVKDGTATCYLVVGADHVELYRNERDPVLAGIVKSMLTAFLLRYNASSAVAASGSRQAERAPQVSYVETRSLSGRRTPGAMDFYAVTILTLIVMYASLFGMSSIRSELRLKTANRILCAPIGPLRFLAAKVFGGLVVVLLQVAIVYLFSRYVLGAYWGHDLVTVGLLVLAESVMVVSIGAGVGYLLPSEGASVAAMNVIIPMLAFFGGSYVPLDIMGPGVERIASFSPLKWMNQALLGVIYNGDYSNVARALVINAAIAAVFIAAAAMLSRRENNLT